MKIRLRTSKAENHQEYVAWAARVEREKREKRRNPHAQAMRASYASTQVGSGLACFQVYIFPAQRPPKRCKQARWSFIPCQQAGKAIGSQSGNN